MKKLLKRVVLLSVVGSLLLLSACGNTEASKPKEVYIYLIRHGQTESNVKGMLVGGGGNYDLTQKGIDDAIVLGENLKETEFVSIYSSPLGRAYNTTEYILKGAEQEELDIQVVEGLRDIGWGDAEGYTAAEFVSEYGLTEFPEAFGDANDAEFVSPINAESMYDFCNRFDEALTYIAKENESSGGNVLVVAHSSIKFWLQQKFPELQLEELKNTTITVIKYVNGEWELIVYNNVSY